MAKRYVHILTGNGKGKTTASIGLAIRAAGAGLKVFIGQFLKKGEYSEIKALKRFDDLITVEQFGLGKFAGRNPTPEDINAAQKGLKRAQEILSAGAYEVVILDEANVAAEYGLISAQDLLGLIVNKPKQTELIITGRYATPLLIDAADIVTEMKPIKHYYQKGVKARVGIEK